MPLFAQPVLAFLAHHKKFLIGLVAAIAVFGSGYGLGNFHAEMRHADQAVAEATQATTVAKNETKAVIEHGNAQAVERVEVKVRDLKRERELAAELQQARDQRDALQDILYATPDHSPDCRVSVGDLRLLNDAARPGDRDADAGASDPARVAAYQEPTPSDVSCRALVSGEIDVRVQYNELATRHDALVDWIEEEVIAPQIDPVDRPQNK